MRENTIRAAIENLPGDLFERFARELLRRELYPGLNPTSESHDLGEDARTEQSTVFLHYGLRVSVFASKTARWNKIHQDCKRCKETGRRIDIVVFTTSGNPQTSTQESWCSKVKEQFGWGLEVRTMSWLAPVAAAPQHEDLVDDYLHVPPPDGDFTQSIEAQFSHHTDLALAQIDPVIPGISDSLPRDEVTRVEDQLSSGKSVLLTGDAGTGKSGIGLRLAQAALERGVIVLFLDARRLESISNDAQLRQHLDLRGSVSSAIRRIGQYKGCRIIVDQLDNIVGSDAATRLVELVIECCQLEHVDVVVISRTREPHEAKLLERLPSASFVELTSYPLSSKRAQETLGQLGILDPTDELTEIGRNLLNLELIGKIRQERPDLVLSALTDEADLWEQYRQVLEEETEQLVADAVLLARQGLKSEERAFCLDYPVSQSHRRLISWGVILCEDGRIHRFRHDKLQDFLYAWDATQRHAMPAAVYQDLDAHRARGVMVWMEKLYSRQNPRVRNQFLKDVFNVR